MSEHVGNDDPPRGSNRARIALVAVTTIIVLIVVAVFVRDRMTLSQAFRWLDDPNPDMRIHAMEIVLSHGPKAVPKLLEEIQRKKGIGLAMCAVAAGRLGVKDATPRLLEILSDPMPEVRQSAAMALGLLEVTEAVAPLTECLSDKIVSVRRNAAIALGRIGKPAQPGVPKLIELVSSSTESRDVKTAAAVALGRIGDEKALDSILKLLNPKDYDFAKAATKALGALGSAKAVDPLCKFLVQKDMEDTPPGVRVAGIEALGRIGDKRAVPTLKILADETKTTSWLVRQAAAKALAEMGTDDRGRGL